MFTKSIFDIIKGRTSIRTYENILLTPEDRKKMDDILAHPNIQSPFGGNCRFQIIEIKDPSSLEKKKYGTYGFIKGAQEFIVGATQKSEFAWENYGYIMEYIILKAYDFGLGTCWLGGTFKRLGFSDPINLQENEKIPAISPIGYSSDRRIKEKLIRMAINAKKRHRWSTLFFKNNFETFLTPEEAGKFQEPIEMVRLGPSASNRQPWRIVTEENNKVFHFYLLKSLETSKFSYANMHKLDIGIAVCHFDLACKEKNISGYWEFNEPNIKTNDNLLYKITWKSS